MGFDDKTVPVKGFRRDFQFFGKLFVADADLDFFSGALGDGFGFYAENFTQSCGDLLSGEFDSWRLLPHDDLKVSGSKGKERFTSGFDLAGMSGFDAERQYVLRSVAHKKCADDESCQKVFHFYHHVSFQPFPKGYQKD